MPNVDGEIGVGYNFSSGSGSTVGLQLGYRGEAFFGAASKGYATTYDTKPGTGDVSAARSVRTIDRDLRSTGCRANGGASASDTARATQSVHRVLRLRPVQHHGPGAEHDQRRGGSSQGWQLRPRHPDRSHRSLGSEQYNQALSVRRGEAVKAAMIRQGIPASAIVVIGRGESQNLVPTADGVREPQNRRVEIVI